MTQRDRLLYALRRAGTFGVSTVDAAQGVYGAPILRLAARVKELRDEGFDIGTVRLPDGTAKYVLVEASRSRNVEVVEHPPALAGVPTDSPSEVLFEELEWI